MALMTIIEDYVDGKIVVAWRGGEPIYAKVTRA
jgi:hypothetical protein